MCWEVWRVWLSGMASLTEIERDWSLCDLMDANDALDIKAELEKEAELEAERKRNQKWG